MGYYQQVSNLITIMTEKLTLLLYVRQVQSYTFGLEFS